MAKVVLSKRLTVTADNRHRLRVWVSETSHNIPGTLFVYQQIPVVPLDSGLNQLFVHVASYADLGDYPENASGDDSPFFRLHHFDLVFDSLAYLDRPGKEFTEWYSIPRKTSQSLTVWSRL